MYPDINVEKLAKKWYRPPVVKVFVDKTSIAAGYEAMVTHRVRIVSIVVVDLDGLTGGGAIMVG